MLIAAFSCNIAPWHTGPLVPINVIAGLELIEIVALPVILVVQVVISSVASTVYVPLAVNVPKLIDEPVPATGDPTVDAPLYNW